MGTSYRAAPEVQGIAEGLIALHHLHLTGVMIDYVFRSPSAKSKGREVRGRVTTITGLNAYLSQHDDKHRRMSGEPEPYFLVEISYDVWQELDNAQRDALVDHELCHLALSEPEGDEEPKVVLVGPDFFGFRAEIERNGLWSPEAENIGEEIRRQLALPLDFPKYTRRAAS